MPRFKSIGLTPAETDFKPSRSTACAITVAVVVPSPASSEVLLATCLTSCAPMFSNLSLSSISFATETPSFVTVGEPQLLFNTTLRPFGPSVTLTALASTSTPLASRLRALSSKMICFAAMNVVSLSSLQNREHVFLFEDHVLVAVELDLGAGILTEQDAIPLLDHELANFAVVEQRSGADGDHVALRGFLLSVVRNQNAPRRLGLLGDP